MAYDSGDLAEPRGLVVRLITDRSGGAEQGRTNMMRTLGAGAFLALAALLPAQQAAAQDPIGGAIVGGALGGIIGGAVGRGVGGVVAGAAIGAATGAIIASEAERRQGGYFWWHRGCYYQYPNGAWVQVGLNYCGY
jgi:hypothetical protein